MQRAVRRKLVLTMRNFPHTPEIHSSSVTGTQGSYSRLVTLTSHSFLALPGPRRSCFLTGLAASLSAVWFEETKNEKGPAPQGDLVDDGFSMGEVGPPEDGGYDDQHHGHVGF